jgi:hypothetical protein
LPEHAILNIPNRKEKGKKKKEGKSALKLNNDNTLNGFSTNQFNLRESWNNYLRGVCRCEKILVYDSVFYPKEYLRDILVSKIKNHFCSSIYAEDTSVSQNVPQKIEFEESLPLKRPSVLLAEMTAYTSALFECQHQSKHNLLI